MKETDVSVERRWSDEYIKELREKQRIICRTENIREARVNDFVNDIVLVYNDQTSRSQWKIGNILELIKSNDGRIPGAIVLTKTNGIEHLMKRPLNCLYPFECDKKDEDVKIYFLDDANIKMMQKADT